MSGARISVVFEGTTQQEIRQKMQNYLDENTVFPLSVANGEDFPQEVKKLYPKHHKHKFSAAMLSVILDHPKRIAIDVYDLAAEMQKRFPTILKNEGYTRYEEVTTGTVLAGNFLREAKLIDFEYQRSSEGWRRRVYWRT